MESELDHVMNQPMPILHLDPKMDFTSPESDYQCPLYKTAARAGVLSTTGMVGFPRCSPNVLFAVTLAKILIALYGWHGRYSSMLTVTCIIVLLSASARPKKIVRFL